MAPAEGAGKAHVCATCGKRYQRNTHLRRHEATHAQVFRYKCRHCQKSFARGDVCRKHSLSCARGDDGPKVLQLRRGQKPRACEACFLSKVSCDKKQPCARCLQRCLPCRFRDPDASLQQLQQQQHGQRSYSTSTSDANMTFLRNLTNPKATTMMDCFTSEEAINDDIPDMGDDVNPAAHVESSSSLIVQDVGFVPWALPVFGDQFVDPELEPSSSCTFFCAASGSAIPALGPGGLVALGIFSKQIVRDLNALHAILCTNDPLYDGTFQLDVAHSVFEPHSLASFITTFSRLCHNYVPIVHMPSLGSAETSPALMLAVAICGAYRSPPRDDALSARSFLCLAEEHIFRHLDGLVAADPRPSRGVLEALQAAVLVHHLCFLMNSVEARRRQRVRRLPVLVSVARRLGLADKKHSATSGPAEFLDDEACIRAMTWIALGDWHQSGAFHVLPQTTTWEMRCDLPCPRDLWDAKDLTTQAVEAYKQKKRQAPPCLDSLKALTKVLMDDHWKPIDLLSFTSIAIEGLELALFAITSVVISAHVMSMAPFSSPATLRAISRWEELWDVLAERADEERLRMTAVARHCREFGCLVRKVIETAASGNEVLPPFLDRVAHDSVDELYNMILEP